MALGQKNEKKGFSILEKAAKAGMSYAQLELAKCYENGLGTAANLFEAVSWYAYAAKSGLEEATERFIEIYYSTHFEDEHGGQRFFWFELQAIDGGNLPVQSDQKMKLSNEEVWVQMEVKKVSK